jgi:hypothetical protein
MRPELIRPAILLRHSVDRIFTSFIQRAFTSISDAWSGMAAIACLYRAQHAD